MECKLENGNIVCDGGTYLIRRFVLGLGEK